MDSYYNHDKINTVVAKDEFKGNLQLEIGSGEDETYVVSFWGDGNIIQVGEHLLYKVKIKAGQINSYEFAIGDSLTSINNFYAIVCPVSSSSNTNIEKMNTVNLSDEALINVKEPESTQINFETNDIEISSETEFDYQYGDHIYKTYGAYNSFGIVSRIDKTDLETGEVLKSYKITKAAVGRSNVNILGDGAIVYYSSDNKDNDSITILNSNLEEVYDGKNNGLFKNYYVYDCCYIYLDNIIGFDIDKKVLVNKNIKTEAESVIFSLSNYDACVNHLFYQDGKLIFDACYNNEADHFTTFVVDTKTGKFKIMDGLSVKEISADGSTCLLYEYVDAFSKNKPYVYLYNIAANKLDKVDLSSPDETMLADISYYGDKVVTSVKTDTTETIKCYSKGTSHDLLNLERYHHIEQLKNGVRIVLGGNDMSKEYKWED